jgi:thioredoxin-dependent peroxiredoxin
MAKPASSTTSFQPRLVPDFALPVSGGGVVTRDSLKGKWTVIFFYPTDDTETCTKEACAFSEAAPEFAKLGVGLYGLSKDSLRDHDKFINKYGLKMPLLSDESTQAIDAFGSWIEKSLYGRQYMGTDRSTFIIDPDGMIQQEWRKIRVKGHVENVLAALKALMG